MPLAWADVNPGLCKHALSSISDSLWDLPGSTDGRAEPRRDGATACQRSLPLCSAGCRLLFPPRQ